MRLLHSGIFAEDESWIFVDNSGDAALRRIRPVKHFSLPLKDLLLLSEAITIWSSGGTEAAWAGVPVVVAGNGSLLLATIGVASTVCSASCPSSGNISPSAGQFGG